MHDRARTSFLECMVYEHVLVELVEYSILLGFLRFAKIVSVSRIVPRALNRIINVLNTYIGSCGPMSNLIVARIFDMYKPCHIPLEYR